MNNKSFEELKDKVLSWADAKDLLHEENAPKQFLKVVEEVFEFYFEMKNLENVKDACKVLKTPGKFAIDEATRKLKLEMGDIFVTLIIECEQLGIDPLDCLEKAYEKISKRKGKTINGTFVKEEDL